MKLTYRGINYKSQKQEVNPRELPSATPCSKYLVSNHQDSNKVILVRPIHYYTYRGVSYTKNLIFDSNTKLLLDLDHQ